MLAAVTVFTLLLAGMFRSHWLPTPEAPAADPAAPASDTTPQPSPSE